MNTTEWLNQVAYVGKSKIQGDEDADVYYSNFDDSYITRVGMEKDDGYLMFLAEHEVTDELTHGVGFSPSEQKWYGWSHRAIFGFEIGSTCNKGDCHYRAANLNDEMQAAEKFWDNKDHEYTTARLEPDGRIIVEWKYKNTTPNQSIHGDITSCEWQYDMNNFGRGEWVAKTLEDAKQMAVDFNEGVS